jgi:hypothetical protein
VPTAARMRAWSMTRSRCRYGREHTTREKLDGGPAWSLLGRPVIAAREKFYVLAKLGFLQEKGSADEEVLGLDGTETCLLRPISRPGRHLTRMVCDPPNRTNQPCRSMRECPTMRIELGLSGADPPLSEASFRCSTAAGFRKGERNPKCC